MGKTLNILLCFGMRGLPSLSTQNLFETTLLRRALSEIVSSHGYTPPSMDKALKEFREISQDLAATTEVLRDILERLHLY